jgi:formate hydrogenlyase subunit 4
MVLPVPPAGGAPGTLVFVAGAIAVAVLVGIVESITARIRLLRVPQFLVGASVIAALGLAVLLYRGTP